MSIWLVLISFRTYYRLPHLSLLSKELATYRISLQLPTTNFLTLLLTPHLSLLLPTFYYSPVPVLKTMGVLWIFIGCWLRFQRVGTQPRPNQPPTNAQSMPNQKRTITGDKQRGIGELGDWVIGWLIC